MLQMEENQNSELDFLFYFIFLGWGAVTKYMMSREFVEFL